MPTKSVTVQYRRIDPFGNPPFNTNAFDRDVAEALDFEIDGIAMKDRAALRQAPAQNGFVRLLNNKQIAAGYVFGEVVRFEPGGLAPLINQDAEAADLDLLQQAAAEQHEFVHGLAYFIIRGPHMAIIERGMRSRQVAEYLSWLLRRAGGLVDAQEVVLTSHLQVVGARGLAGVKRARFALVGDDDDVPPPEAPHAAAQAAAAEADIRGRGVAEGAQAWSILETLNMADGALVAEASVPGTKLSLNVSFNLKRGRSMVQLPEDTLRDYLDEHPESEIVLEGERSNRKGSVILLKRRSEVEMVGPFIRQDSAVQVLFEALEGFEEQANAGADD